MRYGSVCSGIEAATTAWHPLGWEPAFLAEIERFPSAVLAAHYPHVPNLGDITAYQDWPDAAIDLLVGGTPCQSFSVAGLRKGLADPRGNLALTYLGIADRYRPEWLLWENVPGVLSSGAGRDFGAFLGGLAELGYGFAYRVLDAQYVRVDGLGRAVAQRRRRVFVVGNSRSWRRAAAVLFEPESLSGDTAPRRETGQGASPTISARPTGGGGLGTEFDLDGGLIASVAGSLSCNTGPNGNDAGNFACNQAVDAGHLIASTGNVAHCLNAGAMGRIDYESETMVATRSVAATLTRGAESAGKGGYAGRRQEDDDNLVATPYTLAIRGRGDGHQLEYRQDGTANAVLTPNGGRGGIGVGAIAFQSVDWGADASENVSPTLRRHDPMAVATGWAVRRLTPTECERLQGFPDGYTDIPWRGKRNAPDGPRYKALGNSMAVNVMRWIGRRIELVNGLILLQSRAA